MKGSHLEGIMGTNPLGFFAALGVQVLFQFASKPRQPLLWWSDNLIPHAVVDSEYSSNFIAECANSEFTKWADSITQLLELNLDKSSKISELKIQKDDLQKFFRYLSQGGNEFNRAMSLVTCLIAEGSLDRKSVSKPTDLYFTAGNQKFLEMALDILQNVSYEDVIKTLDQTWPYDSELPSLMWDVTDSREYALRARNPSSDKKKTNPGSEALAVLGLCLYPVFGSRERTLTTGCSGKWKNGYFSWPLWSKPAKFNTVKSLVAHAYSDIVPHQFKDGRDRWFRSWGIFRIYQASIVRSDQGGYGTFSPPEVTWQSN